MAQQLVRSFEFGSVFSRTFATLFGGFGKLFGIALAIQVPVFVLGIGLVVLAVGLESPGSSVDGSSDVASLGRTAAIVVFTALVLFSMLLVQAATVNAAMRQLRRQPVSVLRCLAVALRRLLPLTGLALVQAVAFCGTIALAVPLFYLPGMGTVVGAIALAAAIVVVVYLFLRWWVAVPAIVIENAGVLDGLSRSARLTAGRRWTILGLLVVLWLVSIAASAVIPLPFTLVSPEILGSLASFVVSVTVVAMFAVAVAIGYHDLRVEKEGVSADDVAAVFD